MINFAPPGSTYYEGSGPVSNATLRLGGIVSSNPYYVTALAGRYAKLGIGPERSANMVPNGDVVKNGGGTMLLQGANVYSGATMVNEGTLLVNGANSSAGSASTVGASGTLGGVGSYAGPVTVNGVIAPGYTALMSA